MTRSPNAIGFAPDYSANRSTSARPLIRSLVAMGRDVQGAATIAKATWPHDRETLDTLERGATVPTDKTSGAAFGQTALADLVSVIGPMTAFGRLASAAVPINFENNSGVLVPTITASGTGVAFLASAAPMPVKQFSFGGPTLTVKKVGFAVGLTRELVEGSNAETLVKQVMSETGSLGIETLLFDAVAADTIRPAGIRQGVAATAATSGGGETAMRADLAALAAAVAPRASTMQNIIFIASPDAAVKIMLSSPRFPFPLFASSGLAASGTVLCLAANCLAMASDGAIRFSSTSETTLHFEDTTPLAIGTAGTPATVAAPARSLWQTDCVAIRLVTNLNWDLRASGAVAWVQSITW